MPTRTTYWKVVGHREQADGDVEHFLRQVLNAAGEPIDNPDAEPRNHVTVAANEQPRGTIVKLVETVTRTVTVNP